MTTFVCIVTQGNHRLVRNQYKIKEHFGRVACVKDIIKVSHYFEDQF